MKTTIRRVSGLGLALGCAWAVFGESISGQIGPHASHKALTTAPGLEVTLFAPEPDVINPTVIAVDERGRVWVAEGVNYRSFASVPIGGCGLARCTQNDNIRRGYEHAIRRQRLGVDLAGEH